MLYMAEEYGNMIPEQRVVKIESPYLIYMCLYIVIDRNIFGIIWRNGDADMQPIRCEGFDSYSLRTLGVIMLSRLRLGHVRLFATAPRGPETRLCIRCEGISLRESHVAMDNPIINQGFHSENHGESWKIRENHPKSWRKSYQIILNGGCSIAKLESNS